MTNPAKTKGTRAETWAERTCLAYGVKAKRHDMGRGIGDLEVYSSTGELVIFQVKHADDRHYSRNRPPLAWLQQAHTQAVKAGAALGILLVKPDGIAYRNVPDWHAWLWLSDLTALMGGNMHPGRDIGVVPARVPFGSILTLLGGTPPGAA